MPAYPLAPATAAFTTAMSLHKHTAPAHVYAKAPSNLVEEAGARARVAGRAVGADLEEDRVEVAVEANLEHLHGVTGGGALLPQAPSARAEPRPAGLPHPGPGLFVHIGDHQHLAGRGVLRHRRHQAPGKVRGEL